MNPKHQPTRRGVLAGAGAAGLAAASGAPAQTLQPMLGIYPTRSTSSWAFYIAKEAGFYAKNGIEARLEFGLHPVGLAGLIGGEVQFTNYSLDDTAAAAVRDPNALVIYSSLLSKANFALMARPEFTTVESLKGKRMGCGRIGDPPYHYSVGLFKKYGLAAGDLQWVPTGTDTNARAQMILAGQLDAGLITAPAWYVLEARGQRRLTGLQEHPDLGVFTGLTVKRSWAAANPGAPEKLIRAHSQAVHFLYTEKKSAIEIYRKYDTAANLADCERMYDDIFATSAIDRVPLMPKWAAEAVTGRIGGDVPAAKTFDYQRIMDMSIVRRLIAEGFFTGLYGDSIKAEQTKLMETGYM